MPPLIVEIPIFGIAIDFSFWQWFLALPVAQQLGLIFALGGWTIPAITFLKLIVEPWKSYREDKHTRNWQYVVLAVDIPPLFVQTPKAVEQIFAHLSGALSDISVEDLFWTGKRQKSFSLEIVSIEGYIQFLVRAEVEFRDLIESAVYAQYPEAEITEVEDYVDAIFNKFPNPDYKMAGMEFKLAEHTAYPIRTYEEFEYSLSKDAVFSDPMAAILENFSRIGQGENLWMHIVFEPTNNDWKKEGIDLVKEIIEGKADESFPIMDFIWNLILFVPKILLKTTRQVWEWNFLEEEVEEEGPSVKKLSDLTPGMKSTVEAIEDKISKIGFVTTIRTLYVARKEVFRPGKCVGGLIGAFNQFHIMSRNAIVPSGSVDDTSKKAKKFIGAIKSRSLGKDHYILNIEELATIWHFPLPFVKTPLLQKAGAKRAEPPINLPQEIFESPLQRKNREATEAAATPPPPAELPYG